MMIKHSIWMFLVSMACGIILQVHGAGDKFPKIIPELPDEEKTMQSEDSDTKDMSANESSDASADTSDDTSDQDDDDSSEDDEKAADEASPVADESSDEDLSDDSTSSDSAGDDSEESSKDENPSAQESPEIVAGQPEQEKIELKLDTLAVKEGTRLNWRAIRQWFEHAQDKLNEMSSLLSATLKSREHFMTTRDAMDDTFDKAFIELGVDQGKLSTLVDYLISELESDRQDSGDLSADARMALSKLNDKKKELEDLRDGLNKLREYDDAIDAVTKRVVEQINQSSEYNEQAQKYFDQIPEGTIQAKEGFYQIDALQKNMQAIKDYLSGSLRSYFDGVVQKANDLLSQVAKSLQALKAEGVDLQKEVNRLSKSTQEEQARDMRTQEAARAQEQFAQEQAKEKSMVRIIWELTRQSVARAFGWIKGVLPGSVTWIKNSVNSIWTWSRSFVVGTIDWTRGLLSRRAVNDSDADASKVADTTDQKVEPSKQPAQDTPKGDTSKSAEKKDEPMVTLPEQPIKK